MNETSLIEPLQRMGAQWLHFLEAQSWDWPHALDGEPCRVYGTGFSSWGAWAQLNGALLLAESITWPDALFTDAPARYRTVEARVSEALALLRYGVGYHATGEFDGASDNRWGGEPRAAEEKEGYDNWHSPLWTCFLAEVMFAMEPHVPEALKRRVVRAVEHDADVQASLGLFNFDGHAADDPQRGGSHPESNAWKAALLALARGLCGKDHSSAPAWYERELRLWASSFAMPGDEQSEETCDGRRVGELVVGSHMAPTGTIIHHRFLHPCYSVFSLLPRVQAARFCARFGMDYPEAAARHEALAWARLEQMILPGRVIYPAGKDWPRWIYGQMYLLPIAAHRMIVDGQDHRPMLEALIETRRRDAEASSDGSLILHRFGALPEMHMWQAHRFESDAVSSLAQTVAILRNGAAGAGRAAQPAVSVSARCHEPLAKTTYERRLSGFFAISGRACQGPAQLTVVPASSPHMLEWAGNGTMSLELRNLIHPVAHSMVLDTEVAAGDGERGFAGRIELDYGSGRLAPPQYVGRILAGVDAERDWMLVHQEVTARAYAFADRIALHTWRIAQEVHNGNRRRLTFEGGALDVPAGCAFDRDLESRWVCVDDGLCLSLPSDSGLSWHLSQPAVKQNEQPLSSERRPIGIAWLELAVVTQRPRDARTRAGERLAAASVMVCPAAEPVAFAARETDAGVRFEPAGAQARLLTTAPALQIER
ncbi:MAG: hypothetical protein ACODAQ_09375 [Phycisphaeraceae bacterium]